MKYAVKASTYGSIYYHYCIDERLTLSERNEDELRQKSKANKVRGQHGRFLDPRQTLMSLFLMQSRT